MSSNRPIVWYHSNRYNAEAACPHCAGIIRHKRWCTAINHLVWYAYQIVADASQLTLADALALHSLGVIWGGKTCVGNCKTTSI